jgi:23S rRNA pseudouridine2605 synthase
MITQGRVVVNGKVVRELGTKVNPETDDVRVDGIPVFAGNSPRFVYLMLNKPVGVVSTASDPNAETTVLDLVSQVEERVYPVGRLDADSAGLLLLTNDGDFANRLTHPRYHVPKIYRVRARGFVDRDAALKLANGIDLPDGRTAPADITFVDFDPATQCTILDITLYEGRNRQIRRMMEAIEHPVKALTRIGFGDLRLQGLAPGTWRKLRPDEVAGLLALAQPTATPKKEQRRTKLPYRPRNPQPNTGEAPLPEEAVRPEEGAPTPRRPSKAGRPDGPRPRNQDSDIRRDSRANARNDSSGDTRSNARDDGRNDARANERGRGANQAPPPGKRPQRPGSPNHFGAPNTKHQTPEHRTPEHQTPAPRTPERLNAQHPRPNAKRQPPGKRARE